MTDRDPQTALTSSERIVLDSIDYGLEAAWGPLNIAESFRPAWESLKANGLIEPMWVLSDAGHATLGHVKNVHGEWEEPPNV